MRCPAGGPPINQGHCLTAREAARAKRRGNEVLHITPYCLKVTDPLSLTIYYNLLVLHFFFKPAGASESKHMNSEKLLKNKRPFDNVQGVFVSMK